ncbi:MAG TPA: CRTAC1 family protein [Bryobacteraceae bacterium]|nr:CRTAC1 family protein [Bryobacteraceae bacterium]HXR15986.1 CRTAC1 family protein [Terriglobales bacterium]HZW96195.1 CRTAC1 family protein [Candidatus Eremiobacteraceae bacterium]
MTKKAHVWLPSISASTCISGLGTRDGHAAILLQSVPQSAAKYGEKYNAGRDAKREYMPRHFSRRKLLANIAAVALPGISRAASRPYAEGVVFDEIPPERSGVYWVHRNALSAEHHPPETLGPGCAFLDYDNDGWMDIYLVNSGPCDFYRPPKPLRNALYKNNRDGTFTDVTEKSGLIGGTTFGMGVAAGDYDNDGYPDLLVTGYGRSILYHNNGDGTFTDVTEKARLSLPGWTTSAVWFDYDNDGRLDLYVCNYIDYTNKIPCPDSLGRRHYCTPNLYKPTHGLLYHNNGDGTFSDVALGTAIDRAMGKGLGVVATDVNNDGRMDLFVANDTVENFLFINRGNNRWQEIGVIAGVGFGENGQTRSGMGVDAADINADGWEDLFVSNINYEMFSLYTNNKNETFFDAAHKYGIAEPTRMLSGWGLKLFDYDNDGAIDLILSNGHPDDMVESYYENVKYKEQLLLFHQERGLLRNVSAEAGPAFRKPLAARGLAVGDYDNDGLTDVLVATNGGAPVLLHNRCSAGNHWLGLKLEGVNCNRDAVGARITWSVGGVTRSRLKNGGGSYLSSHDPRVILGLGASTKIDWVEIKWPLPSGKTQRLVDLPTDRYVTIIEGKSE